MDFHIGLFKLWGHQKEHIRLSAIFDWCMLPVQQTALMLLASFRPPSFPRSWIWVSIMAQEIRVRHKEFPDGICLEQSPYKQKIWNKMNSISYLWFSVVNWNIELLSDSGFQVNHRNCSRSFAFQVVRIQIEADRDTLKFHIGSSHSSIISPHHSQCIILLFSFKDDFFFFFLLRISIAE